MKTVGLLRWRRAKRKNQGLGEGRKKVLQRMKADLQGNK